MQFQCIVTQLCDSVWFCAWEYWWPLWTPWRKTVVTQLSIFPGSPLLSHRHRAQCQCWQTEGSLKAQAEISSKPHVSFIYFNRKCHGTREIPFIFLSSCTKCVWLNTVHSATRALEGKFPPHSTPRNLMILRQNLENRLNWDIPYNGWDWVTGYNL